MTLDQTANFVNVAVSGTHTASDTEISLEAGQVSELPDPDNGEYNLVWWDAENFNAPDKDSEVEIVRVTGRDTGADTITVQRGQEDTSAVAHDSGDVYRMLLGATSKVFQDIPNLNVENFSTNGDTDTVPVSQGDGTLQMQELSGGLDRVTDTEGLVPYKQSFVSIRNRASWIEHILNNQENMADEITSSQVLTHYVFEAENDAYDRFIDPNHNLGLFAYNNDSEPVLSSIYEASMFLAPTSFLEGLMTIQTVADTISNSELLMDAVMTGDNILENQFGKEVTA